MLISVLSLVLIAGSTSALTENATLVYGVALFTVVVAVGWAIVSIIIAVWVYRDAEDRGQNGVLWVVGVLLLGIVGLVIWLIARDRI